MAPSVRHRGLFPFPVPQVARSHESAGDASRKVRRRLESQCHVDEWVKDIVISLNAMFSGSEEQGSFDGGGRFTLSQSLCLQRLRDAVLVAGKPPTDLSGQEALRELRTRTGYSGEPVNLVPLEVERLSLPAEGSRTASLETILQGEAESFVHRLHTKLSADGVVMERKVASGLTAPYMDPMLKRNSRAYAQFCRRLQKSGVVEFQLSFRERVGAFAVAKKNGKQRLVIDARIANLHFEPPEKVRLATGSTFSMVEVDDGPAIEVGGVDIADAFYNILLPESLRGLFALPGIRARDVGIDKCQGQSVGASTLVYPVLRVVPMGWTHALWICQYAHEAVVNANPYVDSRLRVVDKKEVPKLKTYLHTEYVDNFVVLTQQKGLAYELADRVGQSLRERGLPTHPVEAGAGLETLGWKFSADHPMVQVTPKRMWKLRLATRELLRVGVCDGRLLERIIGHYTFAGLLQRGFLSIFQACYVFIRKHYDNTVQIWPEVHRELFWASSLICLIRRDLKARWSSTVHATDASFWGRGVTSTERDVEQIRSVAGQCDRWRFSAGEEKQVCHSESLTAVQRLDPESLQMAVQEPVGDLDLVREVPLGFIGEDWKKVDSARWERVEGIPTLEGRSVVWLGQHLARSQKNLGRRHLILTDSMSVTLSLTKGRSSTRSLNRVCRQMAALELMSGMQFSYRWLPSEVNPADFPSRAQAIAGFSLNEGVDKLRASHAAKEVPVSRSSWRVSALRQYEQELSGGCKAQGNGQAQAGEGAHQEGGGQARCEGDQSSPPTTTTWGNASIEPGGAEDLLGVPHSDAPQVDELQASLGRIPGLGHSQGAAGPDAERAGHCPHQQVERDVLLGLHRGRCSHPPGGGEVLPRRRGEDECSSQKRGCHEGVPETGTGPGEGANAMALGMCGGADLVGHLPGCSALDVDYLGNMLSSRGSPQVEEKAPGGAIAPEQVLDRDPECRTGPTRGEEEGQSAGGGRADRAVQGGRTRRGHLVGPAVPPGVGASPVRACQGQAGKQQDVRCGPKPGGHSLQRDHHGRGLRQRGCELHVPAPSRERQHGCVGRPAHPHRSPKERALAGAKVSAPLQQRGACVPGVLRADRRAEGQSHEGGGMDGQDFRTWRSRQKLWEGLGLELFSGCGRFSKAIRKRLLHLFCVEVDIAHGPQFDLNSHRIQQEIINLLKSHQVKFIWMGTPCNSWSRARKWDGRGPGPLRDDHEGLMGLPNLSDKDQHKVKLGNALMRFSAKIFRICMALDIPVVLENPHTSRIWLSAPIRHLLQHPLTSYDFSDFCQDGTPWRKRTGFMSYGLDLRYAVRHCSGPRGICSRTGLQHQHLQGAVNGQFMTLAAQPYPLKLCRRMATCFEHACMRRRSAKLWKFFQGL